MTRYDSSTPQGRRMLAEVFHDSTAMIPVAERDRAMVQPTHEEAIRNLGVTAASLSHSDDPMDASADLVRIRHAADMVARTASEDDSLVDLKELTQRWLLDNPSPAQVSTQGWQLVSSEHSRLVVAGPRNGVRRAVTDARGLTSGYAMLFAIFTVLLFCFAYVVWGEAVAQALFAAGFVATPITAVAHVSRSRIRETIVIDPARVPRLEGLELEDNRDLVAVIREARRLSPCVDTLPDDVQDNIYARIHHVAATSPMTKAESELELYRERNNL